MLKVHPENPSQRQILKACEVLEKGGVIVYPTDTVYAMGCDIFKPRAVERIARLKGLKLKEADFSFIFSDLSQITDEQFQSHVRQLNQRPRKCLAFQTAFEVFHPRPSG